MEVDICSMHIIICSIYIYIHIDMHYVLHVHLQYMYNHVNMFLFYASLYIYVIYLALSTLLWNGINVVSGTPYFMIIRIQNYDMV